MTIDPWAGLVLPSSSTAASARRVDAAIQWDLFWGVDHAGRVLLMLKHDPANAPTRTLPRLRDIELVQEALPDNTPILVLRLLDARLRDVFQRLCDDIVASVSACLSEGAAVATTLNRTWRWHHLLRGGSGGLLRPHEQKGLLGELLVLEQYFLPSLPAEAALTAWRGPLNAPQDFVLGGLAVESKARGGTESGSVIVSSEHQLSAEGLESLFLHVSVLDQVDQGDPGAFSLSDVARRLRDILPTSGTAQSQFEALCAAAGFCADDDYSEYAWSGTERRLFRVAAAFPRLTKADLPAGVSDVTYTLTLPTDSAYLVSPDVLRHALASTRQ